MLRCNENVAKGWRRFLNVSMIITVVATACAEKNGRNDTHHTWAVYNEDKSNPSDMSKSLDSSKILRVAIASIISPVETYQVYNEMLDYIESKTGMKIQLEQRKKYREINKMLKDNTVDVAFICSGPYAYGSLENILELLVVPEIRGRRKYQAYLIVHKDSKITSFQDLKGKNFVFTDSMSNTGMIYPHKRLKDINEDSEHFFANTYFSNSHDYSLDLLNRGIVDGASVNSLVFDFIRIKTPEKVSNINIIECSEWYGIPPVVVSRNLSNEKKLQLKKVFLNMNRDKEGRKILDQLMIDRYVEDSDTIYNSVRQTIKYIGNEAKKK